MRRFLQRGDRLLGELHLKRLDLPQRAPRGLDVPGGVCVDSDPCLGPQRFARGPHLADVVTDPEFQLEG